MEIMINSVKLRIVMKKHYKSLRLPGYPLVESPQMCPKIEWKIVGGILVASITPHSSIESQA